MRSILAAGGHSPDVSLGGLYRVIARAMVDIHDGIAPVLGKDTFVSWALAIVLLVAGVRLVLVPAFVKQIKSTRTMQLMQPKIKELQAKYKNDKETLNREMMALQKEHGNPLLGCLPMLLQIPLFLALFRTMNTMKPTPFKVGAPVPPDAICPTDAAATTVHYCYKAAQGLSAHTVQSVANAKAFGVSISSAFTSPKSLLEFLGANSVAVKVTTVVLIIVMSLTTYFTQQQAMKRNGPVTDPNQAQIQKVLLYMGPLFLAIFGVNFPVGVLIYWLTTNVWSLGQQHIVLGRLGPPPGAAGALPASGKAAGKTAASPSGKAVTPTSGSTPATPPAPSTGGQRPQPKRKKPNKNRKGGRR